MSLTLLRLMSGEFVKVQRGLTVSSVASSGKRKQASQSQAVLERRKSKVALVERSTRTQLEAFLRTEKARLETCTRKLRMTSPTSKRNEAVIKETQALLNSVRRISEDLMALLEGDA